VGVELGQEDASDGAHLATALILAHTLQPILDTIIWCTRKRTFYIVIAKKYVGVTNPMFLNRDLCLRKDIMPTERKK
jgi:hypothetical protein